MHSKFQIYFAALALVSLPLEANEVLDILETEDAPRRPVNYDIPPAKNKPNKNKGISEKVFDPERISRDWLWERRESVRHEKSVLYRSETNPWIQNAALDAFWHWEYQNGNIDDPALDNIDLDTGRTRRMRIGGLIRAFYHVDLEGQVLLGRDFDYLGIETLQLRGHLTQNTYLSLGKARVPFSYNNTLDPTRRRIPRLPTLTAQLAPANSLGALLEGTSNGDNGVFSWGLGWYSGNVDKNIPDIDSNSYLLAKLGYFVPSTSGDVEEDIKYRNYQHWHLDYIYNMDGAENVAIRSGHRHLFSTGLDMRIDRMDAAIEVLFATGNVSTVWGVNTEFGYWLYPDFLRLVGRFQYAESDEDGGLLVGFGPAQSESDLGLPFGYQQSLTGDTYYSLYLGADFHIYQNNAVMGAGVELQSLNSNSVTGKDIESIIFHWNTRIAF